MHIGHATSSLPGDVIARYHRLKGNTVIMVSGSDCHITLEGEKLSKSKGNYIAVRDLLKRYLANAIRYYSLYNEAPKKDFNFSFKDFIASINGELLGKWGNFVHRNLMFIHNSFHGEIKEGKIDLGIEEEISNLKKCK